MTGWPNTYSRQEPSDPAPTPGPPMSLRQILWTLAFVLVFLIGSALTPRHPRKACVGECYQSAAK